MADDVSVDTLLGWIDELDPAVREKLLIRALVKHLNDTNTDTVDITEKVRAERGERVHPKGVRHLDGLRRRRNRRIL